MIVSITMQEHFTKGVKIVASKSTPRISFWIKEEQKDIDKINEFGDPKPDKTRSVEFGLVNDAEGVHFLIDNNGSIHGISIIENEIDSLIGILEVIKQYANKQRIR